MLSIPPPLNDSHIALDRFSSHMASLSFIGTLLLKKQSVSFSRSGLMLGAPGT